MEKRADFYSRTEKLLGSEAVKLLDEAVVTVIGIGGVGSYSVEGLVRCGIGNLRLADPDVITESNLNRQVHALCSTLGKPKVFAMKERAEDINPDIRIKIFPEACRKDNFRSIAEGSDYIIDACDMVTAKLEIIEAAGEAGIPLISCMGTAGRLTGDFVIGDISGSHTCPLARTIRKELRQRNILNGVEVLFSPSPPEKIFPGKNIESGGNFLGSVSFVPSVAGMMLCGHVVRRLVSEVTEKNNGSFSIKEE